jgi:hypothetical protein
MTPDERTRLSLELLRQLERVSLAREFGYTYDARAARAEADRIRLILLTDEPTEETP